MVYFKRYVRVLLHIVGRRKEKDSGGILIFIVLKSMAIDDLEVFPAFFLSFALENICITL